MIYKKILTKQMVARINMVASYTMHWRYAKFELHIFMSQTYSFIRYYQKSTSYKLQIKTRPAVPKK